MKNKKRVASWGTRFAINFFTLILIILFFWFLGFCIKDLRTLPPPDYHISTASFFDPELQSESAELAKEIGDKKRTISMRRSQEELLRDTLRELERSLACLGQIAAGDRGDVAVRAEQQILEQRQQHIELGMEIVVIVSETEQLERKKADVDKKLSVNEQAARAHYAKILDWHRVLVALYQACVVVPFFVIPLYCLVRYRKSAFLRIFLALGVAAFFQIGFLMFEYFPREYFKYILIGSLIAAVIWLLIYVLRSIAKPTLERILKQNRESYERFLCVNCEFPIRTGPRTFLYWTRRTVHKALPQIEGTEDEKSYQCPYCGTLLYENCPACGKVRHAQLEFCRHCGDKKEIEMSET